MNGRVKQHQVEEEGAGRAGEAQMTVENSCSFAMALCTHPARYLSARAKSVSVRSSLVLLYEDYIDMKLCSI
jgi:hypothetical protein